MHTTKEVVGRQRHMWDYAVTTRNEFLVIGLMIKWTFHTWRASSNIPHQNDTVFFIPTTNIHWHIIVTLSPQFTLWFTLGFVYSMKLEKCVMTYTHHYGIFTIPGIRTLFILFSICKINQCKPKNPISLRIYCNKTYWIW